MASPGSGDVAAFLKSRGLVMPDAVAKIYDSDLPSRLDGLLFGPSMNGRLDERLTFEWAENEIDRSEWPLLPNLLPIMLVDEQSFACVVLSYEGDDAWDGEEAVVRWHVNAPDEERQAALLDIDCFAYVESVAQELADPVRTRLTHEKGKSAREVGLARMLDVIGPAYQETYLAHEKRPRDFVLRPVRVACQNVIVALAAISQDSTFDGLAVAGWQTCEVPHVAAHEANRALTAIMLCDAFQNGGTMEIRFDRKSRVKLAGKDHYFDGHPEGGVPASLRRYGRTVGVELGVENPQGISPGEARELFLAITPMPDGLRARVDDAIHQRGISPERLCFTLLNPVWRDIELDYLLGTSARAVPILEGGSNWRDRSARQAETESCRAAVMAGMLYRRLNATDAAGSDEEARVVEDRKAGIEWEVLEDSGAIRFTGLTQGAVLPWSRGDQAHASGITVFPRTLVTAEVIECILDSEDAQPVLVVPRDTDLPTIPTEVLVLTCPDRRPDIDKTIEAKLLMARISRG